MRETPMDFSQPIFEASLLIMGSSDAARRPNLPQVLLLHALFILFTFIGLAFTILLEGAGR